MNNRLYERTLQNGWPMLLISSWFACALPHRAAAQTYTILHQFATVTNFDNRTNSDGLDPNGLVLSGDTLYGTASFGGTNNTGTVFAVNTNGTGFTLLYTFSAINAPCGPCPNQFSALNSDGFRPSGLLLSGNTLYGANSLGGAYGSGTIFTVNTDGTGFTTLYSFSPVANDSYGGNINSDGAGPDSLILSGNTLYGAAISGGNNSGTIFAVNTDGTGFTILYSFAAAGFTYTQPIWTNSDGFGPNTLVLSQGRLYGTTSSGGSSGSGEVFALNTDGTGFTILHRFTALNTSLQNSGGGMPMALVLSGGILYGATLRGGSSGVGTVFSVNTNGTGFKTLINATQQPVRLLSAGTVLYGLNGGGVFSLNTDGSGFTILDSISEPTSFQGALIWSGNTLYGGFGTTWYGTVFSVSLPVPPPTLTIAPDNYGGFFINAQGSANFSCQLQRAPNATGPWSTSASQTSDASGLIQFHDLFPPPDRAFYRTVQP